MKQIYFGLILLLILTTIGYVVFTLTGGNFAPTVPSLPIPSISPLPTTSPMATPVPTNQSGEENFKDTGNLARNLPGQPQNVWLLVYEEPGQPGGVVVLDFNSQSQCFDPDPASCQQIELRAGDPVAVTGVKTDSTVLVNTLVVRGAQVSSQPMGTVSVYYSQEGVQNCEQVEAVERQVSSNSRLPQQALEALLEGPNQAERNRGLVNNIPREVELLSLTVQDQRAIANFSQALNQVAGSCRVQAIRAQIEQTLLQFPQIEEVIIEVNGEREGILQP